MRCRSIAFIVAFAIGFGLTTASQGNATPSVHLIPCQWVVDPTVRVDSVMPAPFNTSTAKNQIALGTLQWDAVPNTSVDIKIGTQLSIADGAKIGNVPVNFIWMTDEPLAAGLFGFTVTQCGGPGNSQILRSIVELDVNNFSWYTSAAQTQPVGTLDLRSAAAHELGHSMSFNNVHVSDGCTNRQTANTMCSYHLLATSTSQQTYYRTLEAHETADYQAKYWPY